MVGVLIFIGWVSILNLDTFDIHGIVLWWWNRSNSTRPIASPFRHVRVTSIPETETDRHRTLRIGVASLGCCHGTNNGTIDRPRQGFRRPIDLERVELGLRIRAWYVFPNTIIQNSFAKVVCLELITGTGGFPVNLIEISGEQDHTADDPFTLRSLGNNFHTTEEEFEVGMHGRRIVSLRKGKLGSIGTVVDILIIGQSPITRLCFYLSEVDEVRVGVQTLVIGTGF